MSTGTWCAACNIQSRTHEGLVYLEQNQQNMTSLMEETSRTPAYSLSGVCHMCVCPKLPAHSRHAHIQPVGCLCFKSNIIFFYPLAYSLSYGHVVIIKLHDLALIIRVGQWSIPYDAFKLYEPVSSHSIFSSTQNSYVDEIELSRTDILLQLSALSNVISWLLKIKQNIED